MALPSLLIVGLVLGLGFVCGGCDSTPPLDPLAASAAQTNDVGTTAASGAVGTTGAAGATVDVGPSQAGASGAGGAQPGGASVCDRPDGDRLALTSLDAIKSTIRGTWQLCGDVGLFHQPQHGVFIGPDDQYVFLDLVDGKLVAKSGLENEGHLEYLDDSGFANDGNFWAQVNFVSDMGYTIIAAPPIFSDDPRTLLIDNEGVETYRYAVVP